MDITGLFYSVFLGCFGAKDVLALSRVPTPTLCWIANDWFGVSSPSPSLLKVVGLLHLPLISWSLLGSHKRGPSTPITLLTTFSDSASMPSQLLTIQMVMLPYFIFWFWLPNLVQLDLFASWDGVFTYALILVYVLVIFPFWIRYLVFYCFIIRYLIFIYSLLLSKILRGWGVELIFHFFLQFKYYKH